MISIRHFFRNRFVIVCMHVAAWVCLFLFPFFLYRIEVQDHDFYLKEAINTFFLVGLFYLHMYVIIPRFLTLKKIGKYIVSVVLLLIFISVQQAVVEFRFMRSMMARMPLEAGRVIGRTPGGIIIADSLPRRGLLSWRKQLFRSWRGQRPMIRMIGDSADQREPADFYAGRTFLDSADQHEPAGFYVDHAFQDSADRLVVRTGGAVFRDSAGKVTLSPARPLEDRVFIRHFFLPEMLRRSAIIVLLVLLMSGFIKIAMQWFKSEKQREALKLANLDAELKYLKSQINPHFLFNSLNTIYSLAHRRSPETEHALVKLSTIMRYMIYQSNENRVGLQQELRYLRDYIDIQRLRISNDIPVSFELTGDPEGWEIAPMLLIPFVENAFKHGVSYNEDAYIHIRTDIAKDGVLHLVVKNKLFRQRLSEKGGVGLSNALKRLDLLYKDAHTVLAGEHGNEFIADLKIALKHDEVFSSR